jgi:hypothetical protein
MPPINPTSSVITDQLTRALGEAVIRIWKDVQDHLFKEAVASQGEAVRSQLAVFLHDKHSRTADPLGKPREMPEPDSLGGLVRLFVTTTAKTVGGGAGEGCA